jgi:hypothetical protein
MGLTNYETAKAWANGHASSGKSSNGNLWFDERDGRIIYSYGRHFPIAKLVTNAKGQEAVLFTTRRYSVTTNGKHIPAVLQALDWGRSIKVIKVPNPDNCLGDNLSVMRRERDAQASVIATIKRKDTKRYRHLTQELMRLENSISEYKNFMEA